MEPTTDPDETTQRLINSYRRIIQKGSDMGNYHLKEDEVFTLVFACIELPKRGYKLNASETDWIKHDKQ